MRMDECMKLDENAGEFIFSFFLFPLSPRVNYSLY